MSGRGQHARVTPVRPAHIPVVQLPGGGVARALAADGALGAGGARGGRDGLTLALTLLVGLALDGGVGLGGGGLLDVVADDLLALLELVPAQLVEFQVEERLAAEAVGKKEQCSVSHFCWHNLFRRTGR